MWSKRIGGEGDETSENLILEEKPEERGGGGFRNKKLEVNNHKSSTILFGFEIVYSPYYLVCNPIYLKEMIFGVVGMGYTTILLVRIA